MATIEEIEEKLNVGINLANDIQKFVQEQDRIARQEERERCRKIACDWYCSVCPRVVCLGSDCEFIQDLRKAIEEGGEV